MGYVKETRCFCFSMSNRLPVLPAIQATPLSLFQFESFFPYLRMTKWDHIEALLNNAAISFFFAGNTSLDVTPSLISCIWFFLWDGDTEEMERKVKENIPIK